jgi:hypothetical protein
MGGRSAPAPAPVAAPPTPVVDKNAFYKPGINDGKDATAAAAADGTKKQDGATGIGAVASPVPFQKDPGSAVAAAAPGGLSSSAVLTG